MVAPSGQRFDYNGGNTAVIADLLERTTGISLDRLARTRLFEPLGITDSEWMGDFSTPMAFAVPQTSNLRIGQIVLDHGRWQGRQIVPAEVPGALIRNHMNPGLRGRYCAQLPKSRVAISTIGLVMRIPAARATAKAASHGPGRSADRCGAPLSAAKSWAVRNAALSATCCVTARGPMAVGNVSITDAFISSLEQEATRRAIADQEAVMLRA